MPNYARLAQTASRLISAAGVPVTLTKPVTGDYDPAQGTTDAFGTPAGFNGFAVRNGSPGGYQQTAANGTLVMVETVELFMISPDAAPAFGDTITMDAKAWKVAGVTPIAPGPVALLYQVSARRP